MIRLLIHVAGLDDASGRWYMFWSGFGADLTEFAVIGVAYHHLNCHQPGCWRPARHANAGYCRKHAKGPS